MDITKFKEFYPLSFLKFVDFSKCEPIGYSLQNNGHSICVIKIKMNKRVIFYN